MTPPRRILAVLECRRSDEHVVRRAAAIAATSGGYLTLVAVVPRASGWVNAGPYCCPRVPPAELRRHAEAAVARAAALVPADVPLIAHVDEGRPLRVAVRRVEVAACDLVVARRRLARTLAGRVAPVPVVSASVIDFPDGLGKNNRIRTRILTFRSVPKEA